MLYQFFVYSLLSFASATAAQSLSAQNATAAALVYGYPLLAFQKFVNSVIVPGVTSANTIQHARALDTSSDSAIVSPNADTLYSEMIYDLSQGDIVVTVPDIPQDQFHLHAYYDPFGDNYALTGSENLNQAGQYRIRPRPAGATNGVDNSTQGAYQAYINSPTSYGILLVRWLVNATNLDAVHSYQDGMSVQNVTRTNNTGSPEIPTLLEVITKINETSSQASTPASPAQEVLGLLAAYSAQCPPETSTQITLIGSALNATVDAVLSEAGVSNGSYNPPSSVDLDVANSTAITAISASLLVPGVIQSLSNGWVMMTPSLTGDYGIRYALRAYVAKIGYLELKAPNAIYPAWRNASSGSQASSSSSSNTQTLPANSAFLYTFLGGKPPLKSVGFWSLTAYTADGTLVPNDLGVYSRGDRSNLTYADGTALYSTQNSTNSSSDSKPFQILVQSADIPPPSNWTSNWLPGPAGGGVMSVLLRFYDPDQAILSGSYEMPLVTLIDAITNGTSSNGSGSGSGGSGSSSSDAVRVDGAGSIALLALAAIGLWLAS